MKIRRRDMDIIVEHARSQAPIEACGALLGRKEKGERVVERVVKARNIRNSPVEYEIPAEEILEIFKLAEALGLEVLGFYHSHPLHAPFWSATDEERSKLWSDHLFLIYSVPQAMAKCYRRISENRIEEEPIEIVEEREDSENY